MFINNFLIFIMGKLQQNFGFFLLFIIIIFYINIVLAIPGVPHQFYGEVKINGYPAPNNTQIDIYDADDNNYVAGTFTKEGKYGYNPIFYVPDPNGNRYQHVLEFYVAGVKVAEYIFVNGMSTNLDLNLKIPNFCGDKICDSGESCDICPEDCGSCLASSSNSKSGSVGSTISGTETSNNSNRTINETVIKSISTNNSCIEDWKCTDWFECFNGRQKRICTDLNECGTEFNKPKTIRRCEIKKETIVTEDKKNIEDRQEQLLTGHFLITPFGLATILSGLITIILSNGGCGIVVRIQGCGP